MAGLPYLPKSLLDESSTWDFASTTQNALSSLQQAGSRLMQPVGQQLEDVVRSALPAPAAPPQPTAPAMPAMPSFKLPSLESWGMGAAPAQPPARPSEPIDMGPQPSTAQQSAPGTAQSPSGASPLGAGGFLGFSLPSLADWGIGAGKPSAPAAAPSAATGGPTQPPSPPRPSGPTAPGGEIDNSSRQSFIRTAYPWALQAADGDPVLANQLVATAISENGKVGTGRSLGEMGFNVGGIQGVKGPAGSFMASDAGHMREFAAYNTLAEGFRAVRDLVMGGRYQPAADAYRQTGDVDRYWQQVNQAGYAEDPNWHAKVGSIRRGQVEPLTRGLAAAPAPQAAAVPAAPAVPSASAAPRPGTYAPEALVPNQITEGAAQGLTAEEALAVCGPAAAVAFARANGRNPTLGEAKQLAQSTGVWDVSSGMHGPASEVQLLQKMGVGAQLQEGADWTRVAQEVSSGKPVIIDTPQHYFVASAFDPQTGEFEFGQSAGVLRAAKGRTRFKPQDLPSLNMGSPRATIYLTGGSPP